MFEAGAYNKPTHIKKYITYAEKLNEKKKSTTGHIIAFTYLRGQFLSLHGYTIKFTKF